VADEQEIRRRVGQLFMLGFAGTTVSDEVADLINTYRPGGVILFARNLENAAQIVQLTNDLQKLSPDTPLLISIDQEGGRVSRLPAGFTIFPACSVFGRFRSSELAYQAASATAVELRAVGINMNMAPVLDVDSNPQNPIIGDRAFSSQPGKVCELGLTTLAGLQDNRVVACGKHFPGHGDTSTDSHLELPVVKATKTRLDQVELRPFRHAIENGLAAVMTAHVSYPALDAEMPATLSHAILSGLLRKKLAFKGLVLTDDLEMRAIIDHYGIEDAAVRSFQAGADMLLICKERPLQMAAFEAMVRAVQDGTITEDRLDASLRRISQVKNRFVQPYAPADPQVAKKVVGSRAHQTLLETVIAAGERRPKAPVG
jgi:beta-N-acetylhexosaminidase